MSERKSSKEQTFVVWGKICAGLLGEKSWRVWDALSKKAGHLVAFSDKMIPKK